MSDKSLQSRALRIYLEEMRELHQQMRLNNEETAEMLKRNGHPNVDQAVRNFQIKFIYEKMAKLIP
jgi:hypothetical protein